MRNIDIEFMKIALKQAQIAANKDEVPIGAIIVDKNNNILSKAYNTSQKDCSQSKHAEIKAIEKAGKKLNSWYLTDCTIYVTLQPCLMCFSLIGLSRISRIVYGAESILFGRNLDKELLPDLYKKNIKDITKGLLTEEAQSLLKIFFKKKRNNL